MNEKDIILLAALGFGAYYMLTRRAVAGSVMIPAGAGAAQTQNNQPSTKNTLIAGALGLLSQWMAKPAADAPFTGSYWDSIDAYAENPTYTVSGYPTHYQSY